MLKIYAFGAPISFEEEQRLRRVKNELGLSSVDMKIYKMNVSPSEFKNITGEFEASLVDGLRSLVRLTRTAPKSSKSFGMHLQT